jgi:HK97 family phage major capsid protein
MTKLTASRAALSGLLLSACSGIALLGSAAVFSPVIMGASPAEQIESLERKRNELIDQSTGLANAVGEGQDLTDEQVEQINANAVEVERIDQRIAALKTLLPKGQGPKAKHEPGKDGKTRIESTLVDKGKGGFRNFGDFALCVAAASRGDVAAQGKLQNAATTYSSEGSGTDGGFAIFPDFRREIAEKVMGEDALISRTDGLTVSGNHMMLPKDETTPWQNSGGIQTYWDGEGATMTESKVALKQDMIALNAMTCLVKATDFLLSDAALLDTYLRRKAPVKMNAKMNTAIITGTGAGMPLGIINAPSLVSVAKETSQAADTIYFENIVNMVSRLYINNAAAVVWLINQNTLPQLMKMQFVRTATSPVPVWLPANGLAGQRFSTLMGYPVIPVQACPKLGDLGDIILADMSQYMTATKGEGIKSDVSIHLHFDQNITAFRFVWRVAGQPWWSSAITPENASETLGSFVALAERA